MTVPACLLGFIDDGFQPGALHKIRVDPQVLVVLTQAASIYIARQESWRRFAMNRCRVDDAASYTTILVTNPADAWPRRACRYNPVIPARAQGRPLRGDGSACL